MICARRLFALAFPALALAACGGSTVSTTTGSPSGSSSSGESASSSSGAGGGAPATSSSGTGAVGTGGSATSSSSTGGPPSEVTFRYEPAWQGVTAVDVVGGFGMATDWQPADPLVSLTVDSSGTWKGSVMLPPGQYPYVLHVTGDADAPAKYARYAVDPSVSAFVACPMASPTYSTESNPCSQVTVPQGAADPTFHFTGKVTYGGQPIGGYLVVVEREETGAAMGSHHYFANRVDSAADGTFDLPVAAGMWRLQVQFPTFLTKTDAERDPTTLEAFRRAISGSQKMSADLAAPPVEMEYLDYAALAPTGTSTLPTTFDFSVISGASAAYAAAYGTAMMGASGNIGDPWWTSPKGTATSAAFNGTFTTKQATETTVALGEQYYWGTWQVLAAGAPFWTGESMVFPIKWH